MYTAMPKNGIASLSGQLQNSLPYGAIVNCRDHGVRLEYTVHMGSGIEESVVSESAKYIFGDRLINVKFHDLENASIYVRK